MTILLSEIYDVTLKRNIESANKNGFIRPTIGECYMTHKDFHEVIATYRIYSKEPNEFSTTTTNVREIVSIGTNKICVRFTTSVGLYAIIGTVAEDGSITYGIPVLIAGTLYDSDSMVTVNDTQIVIIYRYNTSPFYARRRVGTIDGNAITFGPEVVFVNHSINSPSMTKLEDARFFAMYQSGAIVGNVSGDVVTFGSEYYLGTESPRESAVLKLDNNRVLTSYRRGNIEPMYSSVATISGDVITFGPEFNFHPSDSSNAAAISMVLIAPNKVFMLYAISATFDKPYWVIADIDGTNITFGDHTQLVDYTVGSFEQIALIDDKFISIIFRSYTDGIYSIKGIVGEVDGDTIKFYEETTLDDVDNPYYLSTTKLGDGRFCTSVKKIASSSGTVVVSSLAPPE